VPLRDAAAVLEAVLERGQRARAGVDRQRGPVTRREQDPEAHAVAPDRHAVALDLPRAQEREGPAHDVPGAVGSGQRPVALDVIGTPDGRRPLRLRLRGRNRDREQEQGGEQGEAHGPCTPVAPGAFPGTGGGPAV
jgi:hypothetical protein